MLVGRITRQELSRRLPAADILAFAPYGHDHPTRLDAGEPAAPLGPWTAERVTELARRLDCVVVTGDNLVGRTDADVAGCYGVATDEITTRAPSRFFLGGLGALETACPVVWHGMSVVEGLGNVDAMELRKSLDARPYIAVSDSASKRWLEAAGVDRELVVVPHPSVLASRLFPSALVEKRLEYLQAMGWYPRHRPALVVQGDRDLMARAHELAPALQRMAAELGDAVIVLVEADPCRGDGQFADALAGVLTPSPHRLPIVGIEDLVASVAGAAAVITSSAALTGTAVSYGRPHAPASDPDKLEPRPDADRLLVLQQELDASFDCVATIAEEASAVRPSDDGQPPDLGELLSTLAALRRANRAQGRRLVDERLALANRVSDLTFEHDAVVAAQEGVTGDQQRALQRQSAELERSQAAFEELSAHNADLDVRSAAAEAALAALRATRTFRWAAPARAVVARLRRLAP